MTAAPTVCQAERVWTLDVERPRAEAVAVRDGRLLAEDRAVAGRDAREVDLCRAMVMRGEPQPPKMCERAASAMATTAGCRRRRSTVMA